MKIEIRKLKKSDKKENFCSGNIEIDRFFIRFAGQNQFRHNIGTTYVANDIETQNILGYITVSTGSLNVEDIDEDLLKKFPKYPLPILRISRLGVDKRYQGRGIGSKLLKSMLYLALEIEDKAGCIGVFVDAKESAVSFYQKYGFKTVSVISGRLDANSKLTMMFLSIKTIKKALKIS